MVCESTSSWLGVNRASLISFLGGSAQIESATSMRLSSDEEDRSPNERKRSTRAFDIADVVERGCAREVATDFMVPLKKASKLWKFTVLRSPDRTEYKLYANDGNFLMVAKTNMEKRVVEFFLYHPDTELFDSLDPAFRMTYSGEKKSWLLTKVQCDCCVYRNRNCECQELVSVEQYQEPVGEGLFNIMLAHVPVMSSNPARGICWSAKHGLPSMSTLVNGTEHEQATALENKKPTWSEEAGSLVLGFKGRSVIPSAKNFQLVLSSNKKDVVCQFGKVGPQTFALDIKYPLTTIQAFAMGISTMFWE